MSDWGPYAVVAVSAGCVAAAVAGALFLVQVGGAEGLGWPAVIGVVLMGGFLAFWCIVLVVLVTVAFARVARHAPNNPARFGVIAGGVALTISLATAGPLALAGYPPTALIPFAPVALLPAGILAAGAVAPWRYGFARLAQEVPQSD